MAEPYIRKEIRFPELTDDLFGIKMIGYNDFRHIESCECYRAYSYDSLHYVRDGKGVLFIKEKRYDLKPGDLFFIPANVSIMYYPDTVEPWRYYWVNFKPESQLEIGKKLGLSTDNPTKTSKKAKALCDMLDELFLCESFSSELYYKVLATLMNILALDGETLNAPVSLTAQKYSIVDEAMQIIRLNASNPNFSVRDLTKTLYVSQRHLGKLFKEQTGMTPVAYLSEVRLDNASELLRKGDYSVAELCRETGFGDEFYFMKQFKKKFMCTVKEYKNRVSTANKKSN